MHRPDAQPQHSCGFPRGDKHLVLLIRAQSRGGNINGLLEKRSLQRIGFVKKSKNGEPPPVEKPFQRYLPARNISLNEDTLGRFSHSYDVGLL